MGDFVDRDLHGGPDVLAPPARATLPLTSPEYRVESTHSAEVTHEDVERLGEVDMSEPTPKPSTGATRSCPSHAEAIVLRALTGIAEDFVRLYDFLEFLFGRFVTLVAVRMVLHREAAVRLLDLGLRGTAFEAEYSV
jgi:hypothetical protein